MIALEFHPYENKTVGGRLTIRVHDRDGKRDFMIDNIQAYDLGWLSREFARKESEVEAEEIRRHNIFVEQTQQKEAAKGGSE